MRGGINNNMSEEYEIVKPELKLRTRAVRRYLDKQQTRYRDRNIETDHCIFISNNVFKESFDPDPVRKYAPSGEFTKEKTQDEEINRILRGNK